MKKIVLLLLSIITTTNCLSQIIFEKGYFINNSDQKVDCLIKNIDWKNNPTDFEYKLSENGEIKTGNIKAVKEFSVSNISKYIRAKVDIDRSSENINKLTYSNIPVFQEEELFLDVLVEGEANLFKYEDDNLKRYFFSINGSNIKQLIFKKYLNSRNDILENNQYKQQLLNNLKCSAIDANRIAKVSYKKSSLIKFFIDYNSCKNSTFKNFDEAEGKRDLFNLTIRPRINSSSLKIVNPGLSSPDRRSTEFDNELSFGVGIEAEFVLPYNKNKWALLFEASYQSYKSEKTRTLSGSLTEQNITSIVDYSSIELPLGIRHYFFLNNQSKLFINASYVIDIQLDSSIEFEFSTGASAVPLTVSTRNNFALGFGYKYNDKIGLELRYLTNRLLVSNVGWESDFKSVSAIFGYTFF